MKEPVEILKKYDSIPKIYRYTFWCTFLIGMVTHLYILTNKLPTFDDMLCLNSFGGSFSLGRWFLGILGLVKYKILGNYSMPMLNGTLAIFLIAIFACLVNAILENDNILVAMLAGGMLVVFPTIAGNLSFMFTGYYYSFAMVLLGGGVWLIKSGKRIWRLTAGSFLLTLSLAIYQAYYPLAIGLFLVILILDSVKGDESVQDLLKKAFWYFAGLVIGLLLYFLLNQFWLKIMHMGMTSHKGVDQMSKMSLQELLGRISMTYRAFLRMFTKNYYGMTGNIWIKLAIGLLLMSAIFILIKRSASMIVQKKHLECALLWVFVLLLPIGIHSIYIMVNERYLYTLMIYADVLLFIFPIILCDKIIRCEKIEGKISRVMGVVNWLVTIMVIFSGIFYVYLNNAAYLEAELSLSAAKSYYTTLITQIKSQEGYREDMEVVLIGDNRDGTVYEISEDFFQDIDIGGIYGTDRIVKGIDKERFMKYYCGYDQNITTDISGLVEESWLSMPCYPNDGAIKIVENKIIVKFSEVE